MRETKDPNDGKLVVREVRAVISIEAGSDEQAEHEIVHELGKLGGVERVVIVRDVEYEA